MRDESDLVMTLNKLPCNFLLSTWHSNRYRVNAGFEEHWQVEGFTTATIEHFYHVGATEELRNAMTEALVANYELPEAGHHAVPGTLDEMFVQHTLAWEG
jgi:DNA adenine methylase